MVSINTPCSWSHHVSVEYAHENHPNKEINKNKMIPSTFYFPKQQQDHNVFVKLSLSPHVTLTTQP